MNGRNWQIGRILGIPIKIHVSWFLVFGLVTWSLATASLPDLLPGLPAVRYWAMGGTAAVLLFASVLLHELGHSAVALQYRIPISQITLFIFGGIAEMRREPPGPRAEFLIAIAGPAVSFLLGGLLLGLPAVTGLSDGLMVLTVLLGSINVQLGLFNLIPGFPLDGGRVLRAGLWAWSGDFYRATRQASLAGQGFGLAFGGVGAVLLVGALAGLLPGPVATNAGWIILIGLFLFGTAGASRQQAALRAALTQVAVGDLMVREIATVPSGLTVDEAVTRHFVRQGEGGFPVEAEGRLVGMISVQDVQALPEALWAWRRVEDIMQPWSAAMEIAPDAPAMAALEQMLRKGQSRLAVMESGRLVGMVTRTAISQYLQLHGVRH